MSSGRERLYSWGEKTTRWYCNAVEYRSFHREVASFILQSLPENPTICDIGCGIGALERHLDPWCKHILAIDLNPRPIEILSAELKRRGISNVEVVAGDFCKMEPPKKKFDAAVFCLAGGVTSFIDTAREWANTLFFVENATNSRSFSSNGSQTKETYFNEDLNLLIKMGIPHSYRFFTAPFGQVFMDRAEAEDFMQHYSSSEPIESIRKALDQRLQKLEHPQYKYYLPNEKPLLMITIPNA